MAYTRHNFKTKAALRNAVAKSREVGADTWGLEVWSHDRSDKSIVKDGIVTIEGPHWPSLHCWYARCRVADGRVVEVL